MHVIGTAGHIDHGKTSLIKHLSGINTDRLKEEQARGMTIDLGFAWITLPSGREAGIVDVPGHHKFIKNMLAGVGGIDLTLLVIAADDGWMPQTEEHLAILDLIGVSQGIVVVTKKDLVEEDWLELVIEDIKAHLASTALQAAPIVTVSNATGENIDQLRRLLDKQLATIPDAKDHHDPLLWIDRVFSITGSGTVVTGTLLEGSLEVGQEVVIQPTGLRARIRGLQTHKTQVTKGLPGSRLAVNVTGADKEEITRGLYLSLPGRRPHYSLINARVKLLSDTGKPLEDLSNLKLYTGTLETETKVRLLQQQPILPGEHGFVQLQLQQPAHFSFKGQFILRDPTLGKTIGGGCFLEEGIPVRGRNFRLVGSQAFVRQFAFEDNQPCLDQNLLIDKSQATLDQLSLLLAKERPFWELDEFLLKGGSHHSSLFIWDNYVMSPDRLAQLHQHLLARLGEYHRKHRLSPGIPKETLRQELQMPTKLLDRVLAYFTDIQEASGRVRLAQHRLELNTKDEADRDELLQIIGQSPYQPPSLDELAGKNRELLYGLIYLGQLIQLPGEHFTTPQVITEVKEVARSIAWKTQGFTVGEFRDALDTTRKYALLFLDYLDDQGFTYRKGDQRYIK